MLLLLGVVVVLVLDYFNISKYHAYVTLVALIGSLVITLGFIITGSNPQFFGINIADDLLNYSNSLLVLDQFTAFFSVVFIGVMIFVVLASITDLENFAVQNHFVYYVLMLFVTIGMILVSAAVDLAALVVSWELVSIPSYMLVAYAKRDKSTSEAAIKFFIIGSVSSALMLFGSSFLYGISGSTNVYVIMNAVVSLYGAKATALTPIIIIGLILVVAGLGFKMGIVPFHWWLPDAYEGSLTSVTTMLAAGSKKVGFAAGFRIIMVPLIAFGSKWNLLNVNAQEALFAILLIIAILTMIVGNVAALAQTRMKRLLAYSSIGQAGYILLSLASASLVDSNSTGLVGGLFHSLSHAVMSVAAFICVLAINRVIQSDSIDDYKGLRKILPKTSLGLGLALFGLAGIPPLIGFFSKFFIFFAAVDAGNNIPNLSISGLFYIGAFVGIITSAISVYYYVRVAKLMWVDSVDEVVIPKMTKIPWNLSLPIFLSVTLIVLISIGAGPLIDYLYWVTKVTLEPILAI
jgi:NADH-quinone oxidoreductase subunit N